MTTETQEFYQRLGHYRHLTRQTEQMAKVLSVLERYEGWHSEGKPAPADLAYAIGIINNEMIQRAQTADDYGTQYPEVVEADESDRYPDQDGDS